MSGQALGARLRGARLLRPLRIRDFRLVWIGETIFLLGDQFHFVALAWLTLQLTGSGLALGTVLMAATAGAGRPERQLDHRSLPGPSVD